MLGLRDRSTQNKLLQDPPENLDSALFIAKRFEAANSTMETLSKHEETLPQESVFQIGASRALKAKVCLRCNGWGHKANQCPTPRMSQGMVRNDSSHNGKVCFKCNNKGHIATYCRTDWNGLRSKFHEQRNTGRGISLSHSENSVRPRVPVEFARSNHDDRQAAKSEQQGTNRIRLTAAAAADKKKVIMVEAKVNANYYAYLILVHQFHS